MTVLVIDDQIHVVEGILSEVSWENLGVDKVWKAYNAVEAKGILLLNKVDIMLCDIEMPGENGLSLLKWTQDQGMEVECIFLTAHADFVYARTAMQLGSFDYILQPARYEDIGNAILRAKQRIQEKREQQKFYSYGKTLFEERDRITDQLFREWYQEPEMGRDIVSCWRICRKWGGISAIPVRVFLYYARYCVGIMHHGKGIYFVIPVRISWKNCFRNGTGRSISAA